MTNGAHLDHRTNLARFQPNPLCPRPAANPLRRPTRRRSPSSEDQGRPGPRARPGRRDPARCPGERRMEVRTRSRGHPRPPRRYRQGLSAHQAGSPRRRDVRQRDAFAHGGQAPAQPRVRRSKPVRRDGRLAARRWCGSPMTSTYGTSTTQPGTRIVIVGGVAGGMSAAARARRLDEHAEIVVLEQGAYVSFANCGLPYHLSGEIAERDALLLHTPESLAASLNLDVRTGHRVTSIDRHAQKVTIAAGDDTYSLPYDALVLSPGAVAVRPPIEGLDHPAVHTLRTIPDVDALRERIEELLDTRGETGQAPRAVVIGAGFIGLEAVEALTSRGLKVHLVELADHVLPPMDAELAPLLGDELAAHGVDLRLGVSAQAVTSLDESVECPTGAVTVTLSDGAVTVSYTHLRAHE